MIKLHDKYAKRGLSIIGIFAYDLESGEQKSNKEIARKLNTLGLVDDQGLFTYPGIKFLEKVSSFSK